MTAPANPPKAGLEAKYEMFMLCINFELTVPHSVFRFLLILPKNRLIAIKIPDFRQEMTIFRLS